MSGDRFGGRASFVFAQTLILVTHEAVPSIWTFALLRLNLHDLHNDSISQ